MWYNNSIKQSKTCIIIPNRRDEIMDISFHSSAERNFKGDKQVRAFLYSDYFIAPHNHDFYEVNIVLKGEGTHQIENACFDVKTGDVFMIPPMVAHAYYDTKNLNVYHILLKKSFILNNRKESKSIPGFLQFIEIEPFLRRHFPREMFLHLSLEQLISLKTDLSLIEDNSVFDTEELKPLKNHTVWKILYWFSSLLCEQIFNKDRKSSDDIQIIKALEYIHKNYDEKITIDLLCEISFLSRSTFLRRFQKMCGCTPMKYLNKYRCEMAVDMMKHSGCSKTEIANMCGFYDLSHMESSIKRLL